MIEDRVEEMRAEYQREDLGKGVRGKYLRSYLTGTNLALWSPDVAEAFSMEKAVNDSSRSLIDVARNAGLTKHSRRREKAPRG
jgi:hypothetical protein